MSGDYRHTATYPSESQYERWKNQADQMGMNMSEFVQAMVEAGLKKFDAAVVQPDETNRELRQQRNDLKTELDRSRERMRELEDVVYRGERGDIKDYVEQHPGATYDEILQYITRQAPGRLSRHLTEMEGEEIQVDGDGYYLSDELNGDSGESWS